MVVAIADVYDAMTAARSYRAPLCPFQVIERFEQEGLQKYKPNLSLPFAAYRIHLSEQPCSFKQRTECQYCDVKPAASRKTDRTVKRQLLY